MTARRRKFGMISPLVVAAAICVLLIIIVAGFAVFGRFPSGPGDYHEKTELPSDLVQAEARWNAHPIAHYRLTVTVNAEVVVPGEHTCQQVYDIQNEQVITATHNQCSAYFNRYLPPQTISGLFKLLEHDTTEIRWGHDVDCGDLSVVYATYDSQSGYPTDIRYVWEFATPANMGPNTYRQYRGSKNGFSCLANYIPSNPRITVVLTPLG